jgi:exodeoxyribonuclease VII large subunit
MMASVAAPRRAPRALTVGRLVARIRDGLEASFPDSFWVEGELGAFRVVASGHAFGSLKEEGAQVEIVMWRDAVGSLRFRPAEGMHVLARVRRVDFYAPQGRLRVQIDRIEPDGVGARARALEELKARLAAEGVFAQERKRSLPVLPRAIGIATALHGAAVRDILQTLERRYADRRIVIRPCRVQGDGAAEDIASAVDELNRHGVVEVIIIGRGGGSADDLWCFNHEVVVRAVARSRVPVVSAVGHEVDWTLADLAADERAATPTAAAQRVVPERRVLEAALADLGERLCSALERRHELARARLRAGQAALADPRSLIVERRLRLAARAQRARRALERLTPERRARLDRLAHVLRRRLPDPAVLERRLERAGEALRAAAQARFALARSELEAQATRMQAFSPLGVLARGYALVRREDGRIARDARELERGEPLRIRLARGEAKVAVQDTDDGEEIS